MRNSQECAFCFGDIAQLTRKTLSNICWLYDSSDFLTVLTVVGESEPVIMPRFNDFRILLTPGCFNLTQVSFGNFYGLGSINWLKFMYKLLGTFDRIGIFLSCGPDKQYKVGFLFWENTFDCFYEPEQVVNTSDENIRHSMVLKVSRYLKQLFGSFDFS